MSEQRAASPRIALVVRIEVEPERLVAADLVRQAKGIANGLDVALSIAHNAAVTVERVTCGEVVIAYRDGKRTRWAKGK